MRLRVRGPSGTSAISLPDTSTWGDLKSEISQKTHVGDFDIKYGYPPQTLDTTSISDTTLLSDLDVKLDGEQLTIAPHSVSISSSSNRRTSGTAPHLSAAGTLPALDSIKAPIHEAGDFPDESSTVTEQNAAAPLSLTRKPNPSVDDDPPEIPLPALEGILVLRIMPDDNSCMFRALGSAVLGSSLDSMNELRSIVAQTIQTQPDLYTSGLLEKAPDEYCRWIQREDSWGGGIELSILSQYFDIEICSINVQDGGIDRFNEGKHSRCILVYSGIHYDVLAVSPAAGVSPEFDRKMFEVARLGDQGEEEDGGALIAARELCAKLRERHYYTDTAGFDIRCNVCGWMGKGEKGATEHAKTTGHMDFGEAG